MPSPVPDAITGYFEADARRDIDAIVALFTEDAVVIDEAKPGGASAKFAPGGRGPPRDTSTRRRCSAPTAEAMTSTSSPAASRATSRAGPPSWGGASPSLVIGSNSCTSRPKRSNPGLTTSRELVHRLAHSIFVCTDSKRNGP